MKKVGFLLVLTLAASVIGASIIGLSVIGPSVIGASIIGAWAPEAMAAGPAPAAIGLDENGAPRVGPEDRCPVCAMKVANHPKFAGAIEMTDGTTYYFCGSGCMIRSWMHPEVFLDAGKSDLKRPVVRDYFNGRPIDARTAVWSAGSDVVGPMGPALVPLADEADLAAFRERHGTKVVFRLDEMDDARWMEITGKKAAGGQ